jgi:hypothetical protein
MITLFSQPLDVLCKPFRTTFLKKKREVIVRIIYSKLNKITQVKWGDKALDY